MSQTVAVPTQWNEIGPLYKKGAPNNSHLRAAGDSGLPLSVSGRIANARGDALPATVEIWQANHEGLYGLEHFTKDPLVLSRVGWSSTR